MFIVYFVLCSSAKTVDAYTNLFSKAAFDIVSTVMLDKMTGTTWSHPIITGCITYNVGDLVSLYYFLYMSINFNFTYKIQMEGQIPPYLKILTTA